jgi:hypothetical protein
MTYILVSDEGTLAGLLSIACLLPVHVQRGYREEGTDMAMHRVALQKL